ncbi:hypothetical protein DOTSEDRAFT_42349, partial [Dothistroma septosporum NZE10]
MGKIAVRLPMTSREQPRCMTSSDRPRGTTGGFWHVSTRQSAIKTTTPMAARSFCAKLAWRRGHQRLA